MQSGKLKANMFVKNLLKIFLPLTIFLFLLSSANAHVPGEEAETVDGFKIEFTPKQILQGDAIALEAHITKDEQPVTGLTVTFTIDKHDIGLSEKLETKEREPGHYFAKYKFTKPGQYEVHVEFLSEGRQIRQTVAVNVIGTAVGTEIFFFIGAAILLGVTWFFGLRGRKKKIKRSLIISAVILAGLGLAYSLYVYLTAGALQGIIVCNPENPNECFWQAHIHAYVVPIVCGEEKRLPIEAGELTKTHTHEEKNVLHWHDRIPYDKAKQTIIDSTPLMLGTAFQELGIRFSSSCLFDKCNGDICPDGKPGTLKMFVNRNGSWQQNFEFDQFVWQDHDIIYLAFDSRTPEEVLQFLQTANIRFPVLGVG